MPAGHQSLGIHLDVRHFAATPVGLTVTATAEVTGVEGRTIAFRVEARDEREVIGDGTHQRVVVNAGRSTSACSARYAVNPDAEKGQGQGRRPASAAARAVQ